MTGIFKANNPYNNLLLLLYGLLLRLYFFTTPPAPVLLEGDGFLYRRMMHHLLPVGMPSGVFAAVSFVFLFSQAVMLNRLVLVQRMLPSANYLPGMSYLLFTALLPEMNHLTSALVFNSILLWMIGMLARLHHAPSPKSSVFNLGMLAGVGILVYFPSWICLVLLCMGILIYKSLSLREWIILSLGLLTPLYFLLAFLFLRDDLSSFSIPATGISFSMRITAWPDILALSVAGLTAVSGLFYFSRHSGRLLIQSKKCWTLVLVSLILTGAMLFINVAPGQNPWILPAMPAALLSANLFFYPKQSWFPSMLHWAMAGLAVYSWLR